MRISLRLFYFYLFAACTVGWAFNEVVRASDDKPISGAGTAGPRLLSWEELKESCLHPEQFQEQRAPLGISIQCTDDRLTWVASQPGEIPLPAGRVVTSSVISDKFIVGSTQKEEAVFAKSGSCHRFKQVQQTFTVERKTSCDEVLGIKGDLNDFCASFLDATRGANPKLVEQHDTGQLINTCSGLEKSNDKSNDKSGDHSGEKPVDKTGTK